MCYMGLQTQCLDSLHGVIVRVLTAFGIRRGNTLVNSKVLWLCILIVPARDLSVIINKK